MKRFLRRAAVEDLTGLSCSTIYLKMQSHEFPRPVRIGGRAVAWLESDVEDWIEARLAERDEVQ